MGPAALKRKYGLEPASFRTALTLAWPALLLATACLLPLLNKAFLNDDPWFLAMARQIVKNPLHPTDFDICWTFDQPCIKGYSVSSTNTLMGYVLVPTVLHGSAEWVAHLTQLVFAWIAVVAMAALVLRFGWNRRHAMAGALFLAAVPPFLPLTSTAMPDVIATAFGLLGLERLAAWKAAGRWHQGAVAGTALALAAMARAHMVLLLPLGTLFLIESTNPREILIRIRQEFFLLAPVMLGGLIFVAVFLATRERSLAAAPAEAADYRFIPRNIRSYFLYLSFPMPLAACWAISRWYTGRRRVVYALLVAGAIACSRLYTGRHILQNFLAGIGLCVLADLLLEVWQKRDQQGLFLMLWLLIPLPLAYYFHLPIKYLLPCAPALILTCFRLGVSVPDRIAREASVLLIICATIYSVLILRSDYEFAEFGRVAMNRLIRPRVAAGEKVWYGNDFSAYWYAPLAGADRYMAGIREPKPGDLLAVGIRELGDKTLEHFPKRILVQRISNRYSFGRTMYEGMGLYTNIVGDWLWGFAYSDWDRYELWRIE